MGPSLDRDTARVVACRSLDWGDPILSSERRILLLHGGELDDVRAIAEAAGLVCHEDPDEATLWDLVIASLRQLDTLTELSVAVADRRIVVVDQDSRTLRARIRRARAQWVVRRPFHPEAFRLLLAHCLYRGPERRQLRVALGAPARFRAGLRRGTGLVADLSAEGCRLLTDAPLAVGQRLLVFLPRAGDPRRTFFVRGRVVRAGKVGADGNRAVALRFYWMTRPTRARVTALVGQHQSGPAVLPVQSAGGTPGIAQVEAAGRDPGRSPEGEASAALATAIPSQAAATVAWRASVVSAGDPASTDREVVGVLGVPREESTEVGVGPGGVDTEAEPRREAERRLLPDAERRHEPRRAFERHVVALSSEAARVLIGRDLSVGGMRVAPDAKLRPGAELRLALYAREGEVPLVVRARVVRNDRGHGVALRFADLSVPVKEQLLKITEDLPVLETPFDDEGLTEGIIVSRMLDLDNA